MLNEHARRVAETLAREFGGKPEDFLREPTDDPLGFEEPSGVTHELVRAITRAAISRDAVVSPDDVIDYLGGRQAAVRKWMKDSLIPLKHPTGRVIYRWGDVMDVLSRQAQR
jgi:hypothetical protein